MGTGHSFHRVQATWALIYTNFQGKYARNYTYTPLYLTILYTVLYCFVMCVCVYVWFLWCVFLYGFCKVWLFWWYVYCTLTEVFLSLTEVFVILNEVFLCFFHSCKANARVKLAKTGHGPHSSTLVVICVVRLLFVLFYVLFVCKCVLLPGDKTIAVNKYIISYHIMAASTELEAGRLHSRSGHLGKVRICCFCLKSNPKPIA